MNFIKMHFNLSKKIHKKKIISSYKNNLNKRLIIKVYQSNNWLFLKWILVLLIIMLFLVIKAWPIYFKIRWAKKRKWEKNDDLFEFSLKSKY